MNATRSSFCILVVAVFASGCVGKLPRSSPPLAELDEPLAFRAEPDDEVARARLALGTFSGLEVERATDAIDELLGGSDPGLRVSRVVENSPGDAAGIEVGDILLRASVGGAEPTPLAYPSEWRALELAAEPGDRVDVVFDRAAVEATAGIELVARVRPPERVAAQRMREEEKTGVVLRTATEVEARSAGLPPGGGAVLVGMAASSPWRAVDLQYGDLIAVVDEDPVVDPQVLLQSIREASTGSRLELEVWRDGESFRVDAPVSRRVRRIDDIRVPLLFRYKSEESRTELGVLLGMFYWERTPAAWRLRLFWLFRLGEGDTDELLEVR